MDDHDPVDSRLPQPPIPIASLSAYIASHTESQGRLAHWHKDMHAIHSGIIEGPQGWVGPDSEAFQQAWGSLRAQHIQPAQQTIQSVQEVLVEFRAQLTRIREQARAALHRADAHLARAQDEKVKADIALGLARQQLLMAEQAYADAVAAAPETFGASVVAAQPILLAAQGRMGEAEAEVQRAEADIAQAHREQEEAKAEAHRRYVAEDQRTAAQLGGAHIPAVAGMAGAADAVGADSAMTSDVAAGTFANFPEWRGPDVPVGVGQSAENMCLATGEQNMLQAVGVNASANQIAAETGVTPAGNFYANMLPSINSRLRQNPAAVAQLVGQGTPQYAAVMNGQNLVTFRENVSIAQLQASTARGLPSMVPVKMEIGGLHNVVVYGVRDGNVLLFDSLPEPGGEARMVPVDAFMRVWDKQRATVLAI